MSRKSPHFYWQVPEKGFEWVTLPNTRNKNNHPTKALCSRKNNDAWRTCYPLKNHTGLFMEFARLEITPEALLEFANRYGNLDYYKEDTGADHAGQALGPVLFTDWESEILSMRQILELWQMASTEDHSNLSNYVHWKEQVIEISNVYSPQRQGLRASFIISNESSHIIANSKKTDRYIYLPVTEKTFSSFKKNKPGRSVLYLIQHLTNQKMKGLVKPQLMLDDHHNKLNLKLKPYSLIGGLWLQCVMALNDRNIYAACPTCHDWFEMPQNVVNKGKKYCSDACKSKAYRRRKKKVA